MEEKIIIEKLKNAIERATKNVIMINSNDEHIPQTTSEGEELYWYYKVHETFLKAMIYHEMLNEGIPMADISMEIPIANKIQQTKSFDFYIYNVISNEKVNEFFIEVKTFMTYDSERKTPITEQEERENTIKQIKNKFKKYIENGEIKSGTIYYDIDKLYTAVNESKVQAIMIIVDQSHYIKDVNPFEIMINEIKNLLIKEDYSNEILFAIADSSRAEIISANKIKGHKA